MLPEAEIVFLDEIFKSNSAILNSLLTILNERKFANGSKVQDVPLLSMFAASNEVPNDDNLAAIFDRFLLRVVSENLDSYHFHNLIAKGIANEAALLTGKAAVERPLFTARDLHAPAQALRRAPGVHRRLPVEVQGAHLPDPLRGHLGLRSPRGQAAQALRRVAPSSTGATRPTTPTSSS